MILRIDPAHVMVWRTPHIVQFGVDRVLLRAELDLGRERLLAALQAGCTAQTLRRVGASSGLTVGDVDAFARNVSPVLVGGPAASSGRSEPDGSGDGPIHVLQTTGSPSSGQDAAPDASRSARVVADLLRASGRTVLAGRGVPPSGLGGPPILAVLLGGWVIPPAVFQRYLSEDIPHLPVTFGDTQVQIGPVVRPGVSACLRCIHLARRDRDRAWPAIASQVAGSRAPLEDSAIGGEAAGRAARIARTWVEEGRDILRGGAITLSATGRSERMTWFRPHAECGCRSP